VAGPKIKKGDRVRVLTGKDRGKEGTVLRALPSEGKLIVEGVNTAKKHQKPTRVNQSGGIVERDMPIPIANVAVVSPGDGRPTRIGYKVQQDGTKVRVCRRTGAEI
jgi:large subunit ribosomal protein L24